MHSINHRFIWHGCEPSETSFVSSQLKCCFILLSFLVHNLSVVLYNESLVQSFSGIGQSRHAKFDVSRSASFTWSCQFCCKNHKKILRFSHSYWKKLKTSSQKDVWLLLVRSLNVRSPKSCVMFNVQRFEVVYDKYAPSVSKISQWMVSYKDSSNPCVQSVHKKYSCSAGKKNISSWNWFSKFEVEENELPYLWL